MGPAATAALRRCRLIFGVMRIVAEVLGVVGLAVIGAVIVRSLGRPFYQLPMFAGQIMSEQSRVPRKVSIQLVAMAVIRGLDGAIYATGGIFATLLGVILFYTTSGVGTPISLASFVLGVFCIGLVTLRIITVWSALRDGEALIGEVTEAEVGKARLYGTPWGDLASGMAARGKYLDPGTGITGRYYMQQRWAMHLEAGMQLWVLRQHGRDFLYAPRNPC